LTPILALVGSKAWLLVAGQKRAAKPWVPVTWGFVVFADAWIVAAVVLCNLAGFSWTAAAIGADSMAWLPVAVQERTARPWE